MGELLPRSFYLPSAERVARALLGKILAYRGATARIVETEAYLGTDDAAAHAFRGVTPRTRVLFGPPGHAYVYLIYGMYNCLNIVAEPEGRAGCVLIRALEPLTGLRAMRNRRGVERLEDLASGPGKLTLAMGITLRHNGVDVTRGPIAIREPEAEQTFEVAVTPRIGIRHNADWPLRFTIAGNRCVSK